jgi:drug/metabolite transporter (DMT)-like permease
MIKLESSLSTPLHEQHIGKGVTFGILAAISFTLMSLFGKIIGDKASTDMIVFARFFISLVLLMPWVIKNPKEALYLAKPVTIVTRSLFTLSAFACFFYALKYLPLSNALLLSNTSPLFVPILAWFTGRHTTPHKVWLGIVLGFIGVGLVLKPAPGFFQAASIIGLASGILAAMTVLIIRRLTKDTPVIQILFYNFFICSILTGLFLPFGWQSVDTHTFFLLLGVGFFGAAFQWFSTLAYAKTPARITAPLMFLCILFGIIADWLIWHEIIDLMTLAGMLCVIVGGIVTIYFGQKEIMRKPTNE